MDFSIKPDLDDRDIRNNGLPHQKKKRKKSFKLRAFLILFIFAVFGYFYSSNNNQNNALLSLTYNLIEYSTSSDVNTENKTAVSNKAQTQSKALINKKNTLRSDDNIAKLNPPPISNKFTQSTDAKSGKKSGTRVDIPGELIDSMLNEQTLADNDFTLELMRSNSLKTLDHFISSNNIIDYHIYTISDANSSEWYFLTAGKFDKKSNAEKYQNELSASKNEIKSTIISGATLNKELNKP